MHSLIAHVTLRIKEEMESAGYDQKSFAAKFNKGEEWMVAKLKHVLRNKNKCGFRTNIRLSN